MAWKSRWYEIRGKTDDGLKDGKGINPGRRGVCAAVAGQKTDILAYWTDPYVTIQNRQGFATGPP